MRPLAVNNFTTKGITLYGNISEEIAIMGTDVNRGATAVIYRIGSDKSTSNIDVAD